MILFQALVSIATVISYWLVTHLRYRRVGLWCSVFTELSWFGLFLTMGAYTLLPISIFMLGISVRRIYEG